MRKKVGHIIDYKKERVVLSDILPYEIPPFFSNRYFYHFLVKNKVSIDEEDIPLFLNYAAIPYGGSI